MAFIWAILGIVIGAILGALGRMMYTQNKKKSLELDIKKLTLDAKEEAQQIIDKAEKKADELRHEGKEKEDRLVKKEEFLDSRQRDLDKEREKIEATKNQIEIEKEKAEQLITEQQAKLEAVAGLSTDEAKAQLVHTIESQFEEDLVIRLRKMEETNTEKLEERAKDILTTSINRLSSSVTQDVSTTTISIPNDDMKGKIIGKEGKNVRAFERAAGVEVIIDDTPGAVTLSSFDPIRRQVARVALENLLIDGRIQPAKIEEFVEQAQKDINQIIKKKGEWAVHEVGVFNFDPRLVSIIGRLYFRYSYGQNVLQHSVEMAHLAGMLAEEVGADVTIAKAGALVHDIGKALDHEIQGTHIEIGIRILRKFGVDERIIDAMKSHHDDYPHASLEASIVQTADIISGSRPGARRDSLENYLKRLAELEAVATSFPGIDKAYALSAGREIRVFVNPTAVNDLEAHQVARDMASKIEQELKYPGEIKVHVIRENRVVTFAR
ncbi:ribonuclease Y [Candidatus Nomurabacteria bacterium]|nr:ribonuclease Y [Candidatus Nomurabacteria bacterium]